MIQKALTHLTGQTTVPNIFIATKHIGGCSDLEALAHNEQKFLTHLRDSGALPRPESHPEAKPQKSQSQAGDKSMQGDL
jgi:glutaredoxin 3